MTVTTTQTKEKEAVTPTFYELVNRCSVAGKPNPADVKALKRYLHDTPDLWRVAGDMAENARANILQTNNISTAIRTSVGFGLVELKKQFNYELASPLEMLLIDQILNCWLSHYLDEFKHEAVTKACSVEEGKYWDRRLNSSQRRYLRAIETLARVQKLLRPTLPPVQLNIAEKQVNIRNS